MRSGTELSQFQRMFPPTLSNTGFSFFTDLFHGYIDTAGGAYYLGAPDHNSVLGSISAYKIFWSCHWSNDFRVRNFMIWVLRPLDFQAGGETMIDVSTETCNKI